MNRVFRFVFILLIAVLPLSCTFFTPTATPVRAPATDTPTDVPMTVPPVPSATATATSAPASLNAHGPYLLFGGAGGIWMANPDGSFLQHVSTLDIGTQSLRGALSPGGDRLALVVTTDSGLDLVEVSLPGGATKTIARLLDLKYDDMLTNPTSAKAFVYYAITQYDSLAWQPGDGRLLAFVGAVSGATSDLYTYDTQTGKISQLTDGPSQAIAPVWSPDGNYILHFGGSWVPPFGGAIGGYTRLDGAWSVRVADGMVIDLPKPRGMNFNFVGWQDDSHFITYDSDDTCYSQNLRAVDVVTGKSSMLMKYSFYYQVAQSPQQSLLFASAAGCADSLGDGVYLLTHGQSDPIKLLDKKAYEVYWLPESDVFQAYPEALFSADGRARFNPPVYDKSYHPAISSHGDQAWLVIENQQGRVVVKPAGGDWMTIQQGMADDLLWNPAGDTLFIALTNGALYAASAPDFTPRLLGNLGAGIRQAIWMP